MWENGSLCSIFVSASTKELLMWIAIAWAVIMGVFLLYDRFKDKLLSVNNQPNQDLTEKRKMLAKVGLGGAIAIVMNADGRPTKAELEEAKNFIKTHFERSEQLEILHHIKRVLALKRPNTKYYLTQLNLYYDYNKRLVITNMLYGVASFNGGITPDEWRLLGDMMDQLHITATDQETIRQHYHNRIGSARYTGTDAINTSLNSMNRSYAMLGLRKGASIEEVKSSYRKLAKQYHPDRLSGEADPEKVSEYTRRFREINEAYEELIEVLG